MTTGREEQGSVGDWEEGEREIAWGERKPEKVYRKQSRRVLAIHQPTKDTSQETAALFQVSPFCLTLTVSRLLTRKYITCQLQLHPLPSPLCSYIHRPICVCLILDVNLRNRSSSCHRFHQQRLYRFSAKGSLRQVVPSLLVKLGVKQTWCWKWQ